MSNIEKYNKTTPVEVMQNWPSIMQMSKVLLDSGYMPDQIKTVPQAAVVIMKGMELDITPVRALQHLHVVKQKVGMSAELMRALILERCEGAVIEIRENTAEKCVIYTKRKGQAGKEFSFTIVEAKKIYQNGKPLTEKDNWKNYPSDMLLARATSRMSRAYYPDIIQGVSYTPEELADLDDQKKKPKTESAISKDDWVPVESNETVIEVEPEKEPAKKPKKQGIDLSEKPDKDRLDQLGADMKTIFGDRIKAIEWLESVTRDHGAISSPRDIKTIKQYYAIQTLLRKEEKKLQTQKKLFDEKDKNA